MYRNLITGLEACLYDKDLDDCYLPKLRYKLEHFRNILLNRVTTLDGITLASGRSYFDQDFPLNLT